MRSAARVRAAVSAGLAFCAAALLAASARAEGLEAPVEEPVTDPYAAITARLGGWSPQFEFGFGVLTQSQDGETTIPTTSGTRVLDDSGDSILTGFSSFGLGALSPVIVDSTLKPRVVLRSTLQIPISDGLISDRSDASYERGALTSPAPPDFVENCPEFVPGSTVPTSTCSLEVRDRTTLNLLWTAGIGIDIQFPVADQIFHLEPALEYVGMKAQPEGSYKRPIAGSYTPDPNQPPISARASDFVKQVGASELFHGVGGALTASAEAYREGPWVWSVFLNGRAAWFLTDREIVTRRTDANGNYIFVTAPAVNDLSEVQWQAMAGFTVRFDPVLE